MKVWEKNPRKNDGPPVEQVRASIVRFGFVNPIVIWTSAGRMVAGHTRLKAMEAILAVKETKDASGFILSGPNFIPKHGQGPGLVKVVFHEFDNEGEADAYALADNKLAELSSWDDVLLRNVLADLKARNTNVNTGTGFTDWQLNKLLEQHNRPCPVVDEKTAVDLAKRWKTDLGQIWEMKSKTTDTTHRIMCGDSTNIEHVNMLMGGQFADVCLTDPPYEMEAKTVMDAIELVSTRLCLMTGGSQATGIMRDSREWRYCQDMVWHHRHPILRQTWSALLYHKWLLFMVKGEKTKLGWKRPVSTYGSVLKIEGLEFDFEFMGHGKSCELFEQLVRGFLWKNVCDPFLGAGATLLACENSARTMRGMELDRTHFAAVIERAARAGLQPKKVESPKVKPKKVPRLHLVPDLSEEATTP